MSENHGSRTTYSLMGSSLLHSGLVIAILSFNPTLPAHKERIDIQLNEAGPVQSQPLAEQPALPVEPVAAPPAPVTVPAVAAAPKAAKAPAPVKAEPVKAAASLATSLPEKTVVSTETEHVPVLAETESPTNSESEEPAALESFAQDLDQAMDKAFVTAPSNEEPADPSAELPSQEETSPSVSGSPEAPTEAATGGGDSSVQNVRALADLKQQPGNTKPVYDSEDRLSGRNGTVVFLAFISNTGAPKEFKLVQSSGHRSLDFKTLKAIRTWKFYPGQQGWVEIPFQWDLKGEPKTVGGTLRKVSQH